MGLKESCFPNYLKVSSVVLVFKNVGERSTANKQTTNKTIYSFNDIQAPGLHTIQYYNIYKTVVKMMVTIKTTNTIYIEDLVHHVGR